MKQVYLLAVFFVVSLSLVSICESRTSKNKSAFRSPFAGYLLNKKVKLFDLAKQSNDSACPLEFPIYHTFCDVATLKTYAIADQQNIMKAALSTNTSIGRYSYELDSLIRTAKLFGNLRDKVEQKWVKHLLKNEFVEFASVLKSVSNSSLVTGIQKCAEKMAHIRSSSLCSICSGRFMHYLNGNKAIISDDVCDDVLDSCASSFEQLMQFLEGMTRFANGLRSTVKWRWFSSNELLRTTENMASLTERIKNLKISDLIDDFLKSHKIDSQISRELCSRLINVASESFFTQIDRILKRFRLDLFKKMKSTLKKQIDKIQKDNEEAQQKKIQEEAKNIPSSRLLRRLLPHRYISANSIGHGAAQDSCAVERCLQLSTATSNYDLQNMTLNNTATVSNFTQNFLSGDVVVIASPIVNSSIDSSYSSRLGAIGTNGNEASHMNMPMNLTSKFP